MRTRDFLETSQRENDEDVDFKYLNNGEMK